MAVSWIRFTAFAVSGGGFHGVLVDPATGDTLDPATATVMTNLVASGTLQTAAPLLVVGTLVPCIALPFPASPPTYRALWPFSPTGCVVQP